MTANQRVVLKNIGYFDPLTLFLNILIIFNTTFKQYRKQCCQDSVTLQVKLLYNLCLQYFSMALIL